MTRDQLSRVLFPLGGLTKEEVRAHAGRLGLRVSDKEESQEICFVDPSGYGAFVAARAGAAAGGGEIVDTSGRVLGAHRGLYRYTVGQRRGLDIRDGHGPYYVVALDTAGNRLVVGPEEKLYSAGLTVGGVNWIAPRPEGPLRAAVRIRYRSEGAGATVTPLGGGRAGVEFDEPQKAPAPGQAAVFYRGEEVLGGGWIEGRREGE